MPYVATERQCAFLDKLLAEREESLLSHREQLARRGGRNSFLSLIDRYLDTYVTRQEASTLIDWLMHAVERDRKVMQQYVPKVDEGHYWYEGKPVKVKAALYGSGRLYALVLSQEGFTYEAGLVTKLRPEHKMTIEQAMQWGKLYGVCCICGRVLTNEESIEWGIGPVCREKVFG